MKRELTPEQRARMEERRQRFKAIVKQVANMSDVERVQLAAKMPAIVNPEGHALSLFNTCLVAKQCETATIVGGFKQWLAHGRCVRKGEHGLMIWFPARKTAKGEAEQPSNQEAEQGESTRFYVATVFDVGQTEPLAATNESSESTIIEQQQTTQAA